MEKLNHVFNVNFTAILCGMQLFVKGLVDAGQPGSIVNVSSVRFSAGNADGSSLEW